MNNFRRFREGPGIDNGPSIPNPSPEACIGAQAIVNACANYMAPRESLYATSRELRADSPEETVFDRPTKRRTKRTQSAKQKKHAKAFGKRMKACGKKWNAKTKAAKAKTDYRTFQAKFCKK